MNPKTHPLAIQKNIYLVSILNRKSTYKDISFMFNMKCGISNLEKLYKPIFYVRRKGIPTLILVPMYNVHIWAISNE